MNKGVLITLTDQAALVDYPPCQCGHLATQHEYTITMYCEPNSGNPFQQVNVHIHYCLQYGTCHCMKYEENYAY